MWSSKAMMIHEEYWEMVEWPVNGTFTHRSLGQQGRLENLQIEFGKLWQGCRHKLLVFCHFEGFLHG